MFRGKTLFVSVMALGMAGWLSGCGGGIEKGPAPNLPYTPEPPQPKPEKKADTPKEFGPSTPVPIQFGPAPSKKEAAPKAPATKDEAPAKADEKKAETVKKDEPAMGATETKKDGGEPKKD